MLAYFGDVEKCDGSKLWACIYTIPTNFEDNRKFPKVINTLQSLHKFDANEISKKFRFQQFPVFTRSCFQSIPVGVLFSKSSVFEICRQKMCRFRVN